MNPSSKRMNKMDNDQNAKRVKKQCTYAESCYRLNPAHFREYSHPHLEAILDEYNGTGDYIIPDKYSLQKSMIKDQLHIIVEKKLYESKGKNSVNSTSINKNESINNQNKDNSTKTNDSQNKKNVDYTAQGSQSKNNLKANEMSQITNGKRESTKSPTPGMEKKIRDSDYRPIVPPTKRPEAFLKVVLPQGKMAEKHNQSAPYHIFYTTINDSKQTHNQSFSITFLELLDSSFGELKCSLQINFMVDAGWLLAHYYFAGYSAKKLTILYEDDCGQDLKNISKKKPNVEAQLVNMATPFGKHHTKMMLLCYEDGSIRVVVSTANLYSDDWENRTQGLWLSPRCPELPQDSMPCDGESATMFKRSLIRYLGHYHLPQLVFYLDRVKRCDFSHINVFLVSSVPGSHFDMEYGMTRMGSLLRQHAMGSWPLHAQASSLGSYGAKPSLWLTGDFLHHFTKTNDQPQTLTQPALLKLIYPSLENVKQSHDGLLGGGCLPYAAEVNNKQLWLKDFLYQWRSKSIYRDKAMPHIKSYTRVSPDGKMAGYYLLTSANISKAAWGSINKGNRALRILSYECGVLFLPKFVINQDYFPLEENTKNRLVLPYDVPPVRYTSDMTPWVSDYLH